MLASVYGPGHEENTGSFGDGLRADGCGACGLTDGDWDGGVQAEGLVADCVENWEGFDLGVCGGLAGSDGGE